METKKEEIPYIFYLYLHSKMWGLTEDGMISILEAKWLMHQWRIPKNIRHLILKEMEILKLIEKQGNLLRLKKSDFNIEDLRKYSSILNIF